MHYLRSHLTSTDSYKDGRAKRAPLYALVGERANLVRSYNTICIHAKFHQRVPSAPLLMGRSVLWAEAENCIGPSSHEPCEAGTRPKSPAYSTVPQPPGHTAASLLYAVW